MLLNSSFNYDVIGINYERLMPLSPIFYLYRGNQFYWRRKSIMKCEGHPDYHWFQCHINPL